MKQTREQLIQNAKMEAMGQLAFGISHELNQPLTGIKGFAQASLLEMPEENPLRENLSKIVEQADRMEKVIRGVSFFARRSELKMDKLDINRPMKDALSLLFQQLKAHNIRIAASLGRHLPRVKGDQNQLQQAFINLITNARDALTNMREAEGGEIMIKTRLSDDKKSVEVVVQDTGCGIARENLGFIFNPFFTTKFPGGGIGLGLAIVYRIIDNHQGKIEVDSQEGKGAAFKITFPALKEKK